MKGVILAGGLGSRLAPLTNVTNKHLLPVFNKPMIYYPIETLVKAGVKEVLVVVSGIYAGDFIRILKNGTEFGLKKLEYAYQEKPDGGIADALGLAETFANHQDIAVVLGDNTTDADISRQVKNFSGGAHLFLKEVSDPQRFGVAKFKKDSESETEELTEVIEKPVDPPSNMAVTGLYLYDDKVFEYVKRCTPSKRNELEITDVNNFYIQDKEIHWSLLKGFWQDAGTIENLYLANKYWYEKNKQEISLEEAFKNNK